MGILILPELLADFQQLHPNIELELSITNAASNLLQRDADLAVRMFRPVQNDLVAKKLRTYLWVFTRTNVIYQCMDSPNRSLIFLITE